MAQKGPCCASCIEDTSQSLHPIDFFLEKTVTWISLLVCSGFIALLHSGPLAGMGPGLPLAFAAWVMVASESVFLMPRLALIALTYDALIPGLGWVWTLSLLLGAVAFLPIRPLLFQRRPLSWA